MLAESITNLARKLVYLEGGQTTILSGVRLIDGTGAPPRDNMTLVIEGDRITSIGAADGAERAGPGARRIDGSGLTVIPGLFDCHIHFTGDTDLNSVVRYSPNVWEPYRGIVTVWDVARALEAGCTTVRALGHGTAEQVYGLRRAVAEGLIPGPRILTSGWAISQTGGHGDPHFLPHEITQKYRPRSAFADGPVECRRLVRQNLGDGADCIKIYTTGGSLVAAVDVKGIVPNFTVEEIRAMTDEAHAQRVHVAAHANAVEGVRNAVLGGVDTIEHGGEIGDDAELLEMMVERGTYLDPTLKILEVLTTQGPELGVRPYGVDAAKRMLEHEMGYIKRALDMGIKVICGTDTALYDRGDNARELGLLVESGFSPMEAIVAATKTSSEALRIDQHVGTLAVGKVGELLALTTDPLADIHSLRDKENIKWIFKSRDQLI
jgi:imidazolonepropionase-like amidohydrolase